MLHESSFSEVTRDPESGLLFRTSRNASRPKARLLLLHGVGSNEANLASLAASLPQELEILLLRGPVLAGAQGFAWYQVTFTGDGPRFNQEQAESSRRLLRQFIEGLSALPTVIAGFSQGGIMSASLGITEPELVAGFGVLSGRILREIAPQIASRDRLRSISAFIAHGHRDSVLPIEWATEADEWLDTVGVVRQTHFYDMAHEIIAAELADFSQWLTKTLLTDN